MPPPVVTADLSSVTDALVATLTDATDDDAPLWDEPGVTKFTINVTGDSPDVVRDESGCQLCLTLVHIGPDKTWRNTPTSGERGQLAPRQPLGLVLTYLLTAFEKDAYNHEQQAMSVALTCFHSQPFHTPDHDFTITIEPATLDEIARLWQSITVPMRVSALLRVAVVFLKPPQAQPAPAKKVEQARLLAGPAQEPMRASPQLFQTGNRTAYLIPDGAGGKLIEAEVSPALTAPGGTLLVGGTGLGAVRVYLSNADGSGETNITAWRQAPNQVSRLTLKVPTGAGAPTPGVHQLAVGPGAGGPERSLPIPLTIAPRITVPGPSPILTDVAGVFTVAGEGFGAPDLAVLLSGDVLTPAGVAGPGQFAVNPAGTQLTFGLPASLPTGRYALRVRAGEVEAPPSWWIDVP